MENLTGSEKQIKWAGDIIADIERYTGEKIEERRSSVIIGLGKGITSANVEQVVDSINGLKFAEDNGFTKKEQGNLTDSEYDVLENAVNNKEITMTVFNNIYNGTYKSLKIDSI